MSRARGWILCGVVVLALCGGGKLAGADDSAGGGYLRGSTRKLGRGLANVATGSLELIRTPYFVNQQDGGLASITVGLVQGVANALVRELAGVYDVVTCLVPFPKEFGPVLRPEFVYAHGDWTAPMDGSAQ